MKKLLLLLLVSHMFVSCGIGRDEFVGTDRHTHNCYFGKKTVYIGFSSFSCHDCHVKLNEYLKSEGIYDNPDIELYGLIALKKSQIRSKVAQKMSIEEMKRYYPEMRNFSFCKLNDENEMQVIIMSIKSYDTPFILDVRGEHEFHYILSDRIIVGEGNNIVINKNLKNFLGL